ncbi:MAG: hypothetical protein NUV80_01010 [Candidatus Berkelbacteria bacterium]|nr:hypothetical protein [Candidatus Berkelbacteria bacterium]
MGEPIQKDQGNTDMCTGYAVTSASELQEGVELSPFWQFAKIKQLLGDWKGWGASLRDACRSTVKVGSVKEEYVKGLDVIESGRDAIANWANWPEGLEETADEHKKHSYFAITRGGYRSMFDAIKASLWANRATKRAILVGALWRQEWTYAEGGIIPESYGDEGFGHAFLFIGFKHINGMPFLVAHLSNGTDIGDKGRFYFSESVVNREIGEYGVYVFQDLDADYVKKTYWSWYQKITDFFLKLYGKR